MICGDPIKIRIYLVLYIGNATCDALGVIYDLSYCDIVID